MTLRAAIDWLAVEPALWTEMPAGTGPAAEPYLALAVQRLPSWAESVHATAHTVRGMRALYVCAWPRDRHKWPDESELKQAHALFRGKCESSAYGTLAHFSVF